MVPTARAPLRTTTTSAALRSSSSRNSTMSPTRAVFELRSWLKVSFTSVPSLRTALMGAVMSDGSSDFVPGVVFCADPAPSSGKATINTVTTVFFSEFINISFIEFFPMRSGQGHIARDRLLYPVVHPHRQRVERIHLLLRGE